MASDRTGKKIHEIDALIGILKNEAYFAVSQDNATRKVEARILRQFINGDNDEPSEESYYSSAKMEELLTINDNRFENINSEINNVNDRIDELTNTVNNNYNTLNDRITREVNRLDKRIDDLNKKLEGWILYGTAIPTNLPTGRLYCQYF